MHVLPSPLRVIAAARALLAGANAGDTASAEAATGYFWGDSTLSAEMNQLADEAMTAAALPPAARPPRDS